MEGKGHSPDSIVGQGSLRVSSDQTGVTGVEHLVQALRELLGSLKYGWKGVNLLREKARRSNLNLYLKPVLKLKRKDIILKKNINQFLT